MTQYAATNASGAAFCRSAVSTLMALLLLRHVLSITNGDEDDDASTYFSLISSAMLHNGLGHKHPAAKKAKTGSRDHGCKRGGIHTAVRARKGPAVHHST
ncbi:hypothetical protein J5N97_017252 [Dioscorea zingiberensis]|uniref:Secreted protein n=1 Tax=Dioscorea zingiberensis TaxID=325984 RepID=A0A9D5HGE5_9LILI|nr:hypothetical protein J5N97_017252 [Dioscorea zingiberensis]